MLINFLKDPVNTGEQVADIIQVLKVKLIIAFCQTTGYNTQKIYTYKVNT